MAALDTLYLRLEPAIKNELVREARKAGRSVNEEAVGRLRRSLGGALAEPEVRGIKAGGGSYAADPSPDSGSASARDPEEPGTASSRPVPVEPGSRAPQFVPAELAASVPGVVTASSLAGPAKPLSRDEQGKGKRF